ncbi:MAG: lysophospholipase, partial [Planctomycetota bacterium]
MQPKFVTFADLNCIVIDGGPSPTIPVVVCHGYGAPGHDLAGLAHEWLNLLGEEKGTKFRFVFPEGPLSLAEQGMPDGRAWWPLNMARL